jgi:hypothetical protein
MRAQKGDFISVDCEAGTDVDTTEVLAIHREGLTVHLDPLGEEGLGVDFPQEYYVTEQSPGNFDLVSEHQVRHVYRG